MARRGPSLASKLLLASLLLLTLPWLAWRALEAIETFLVDGQLRALALIASGSTTLLRDHAESLGRGAGPGTTPHYAWPLSIEHRFDGYPGDWAEHPDPGLAHGDLTGTGGLGMRVRLGTRDGRLLLLVEVRDPDVAYRRPGDPGLEHGDQLRLELHGDDGRSRYHVLAAEGPGRVTAQRSTPGWTALGGPDDAIEAAWQPTGGGYAVEIALPLALLATHPVLRLAAIDAVPSGAFRARRELATPPLRPRYRDPVLEALLDGPASAPARTWVVDREGWVRASVGGASGLDDTPDRLARLALAPLDAALAGRPTSTLVGAAGELLVSAAPLHASGALVGAVLVEQGRDALLHARYRTFAEFALASFALLGASMLALLLFSARLAWRIRRLGREASAAIDPRGRQVADRLTADAGSGDELGELSRAISGLLARLRRHTRFLEGLPRTLRHEISNPLNTLATALQNLAEEPSAERRADYIARAGRGLERLERTLNGLTEAADLEEALRGEPPSRLDLDGLLGAYLESFAMQHPGRRLEARLAEGPCWIDGVDHRIEQLLDKLLDNAVDFTPAEGRIVVTLARDADGVRLSVENDGPPLPAAVREGLFETLVSARPGDSGDRTHLGIGLYVVRRIAEAHGGRAWAEDRPGGGGVRISARFPAAN